jgi:DNA-binding FadR family transcriptional regulator
MPSPPIRVPKTAELVARHIRNRIVRGELEPDEALPSESVLMEEFDISRPTLREAFRILESEGLITVRRGARGGARVHVPDSSVAARYAGFVLQNRGATVADVLEARVIVESPAAGIVARRRDHVACSRKLRGWLTDAGAQIDTPAYSESFHGFNRLLVSLTANETLILVTMMIETICDAATASYERVKHAEDQKLAHQAHRTRTILADLIEEGNDVEAEELWRRHLTDAGRVLVTDQASSIVDLLA